MSSLQSNICHDEKPANIFCPQDKLRILEDISKSFFFPGPGENICGILYSIEMGQKRQLYWKSEFNNNNNNGQKGPWCFLNLIYYQAIIVIIVILFTGPYGLHFKLA